MYEADLKVKILIKIKSKRPVNKKGFTRMSLYTYYYFKKMT